MNELLALVAGFSPGGRTLAPAHSVPDDTWPAIAHRLRRERLTGLALAATMEGVLDLTAEQLAELGQLDRIVQGQALRAERLTLDLCDALRDAGVDHLVLKGPALAHGYYPDPAHRPFTDVDLLVRGEDLDAVLALLRGRGAQRLVPELRPGFDRRFAKSVTMRDPSGVEIDLHRTLALGPLVHLITPADLWAEPIAVEVVPGMPMRALGPDPAFLHACVHAVTGSRPGALMARDVLVTAGRSNLPRCAEIAARWRATAVVGRAVDGVSEAGLPLSEPLARWRSTLHPTRTEDRILRTYARADRPRQRLALNGARYAPGVRGKASYLAALALPSRDNLAARSRSVSGHAGRAARALLRRGGP